MASGVLLFVSLLAEAAAATLTIRNSLDDGTGAYAIGTAAFVLFDNTDSNFDNDGFGVLGRMTISNAAIATLYGMGNIAAIESAFEPFATPFSLESTGLAGAFLESRADDTRASENAFGGSAIYLWAYKGSSITAATEHLIAQLGTVFPTDPETGLPLTANANLRPGEVTSVIVGGLGAFSFDYEGGSGPLPAFNTVAVVPEPSVVALLGLGLCFVGRHRRLDARIREQETSQ